MNIERPSFDSGEGGDKMAQVENEFLNILRRAPSATEKEAEAAMKIPSRKEKREPRRIIPKKGQAQDLRINEQKQPNLDNY